MATPREEIRRHLAHAATLDQRMRIEYWQALGSKKIFAAADEIVRLHCEENDIDPKLDRTVAVYRRGSLPRKK